MKLNQVYMQMKILAIMRNSLKQRIAQDKIRVGSEQVMYIVDQKLKESISLLNTIAYAKKNYENTK